MRKITQLAVNAFNNREQFSQSNMRCDGNALYLHGNKIAEHRVDGVYISNAGWESNTTKERLNGLGAGIYQKNWTWYWKDGKLFPFNTFVKLR